MSGREVRRIERELATGPVGTFSPAELDGLPPLAQHYLATAIAHGAPLTTAVDIRMKGRIKVGRWMPFRAHQVLNPHAGFVWAARVAGLITGSDRYVDGEGAMAWRLAGVKTIVDVAGPDVSRSAAMRGAAEAVWIPTALLPRFGVAWSAEGADTLAARWPVHGDPFVGRYRVSRTGHLRAVWLDRWGDPGETGTFEFHPFGAEFTAHATFGKLTVPSEGRVGWFFGTERWPEGAFFEFRITDLRGLDGADGSLHG